MQRILVVDDQHLVADTLSLIFRHHGFETRVAYSAGEALASAVDFDPHLLLCDVAMPGRNGLDLIADMARELPRCRVLVLTGSYSSLPSIYDHVRKMTRPVSILTKPCNPVDLIREAGAMLAYA